MVPLSPPSTSWVGLVLYIVLETTENKNNWGEFFLSVYLAWWELEERDWGREGGGGADNPRDLVLDVLTLHSGLQLQHNRGRC